MKKDQVEKVVINSEEDFITARRIVRRMSKKLGFGITDVTRIITSASELARNVFCFAGSGVMWCRIIKRDQDAGIELTFLDEGPGIAKIDKAMQVGYTTIGALGLGLPGVKRLMDEMEISSQIGKGTRATVRKWIKRSGKITDNDYISNVNVFSSE